MELFFKIAFCGLSAAILATVIRGMNREYALLLSLAAGIVLCILGSGLLTEVKERLEKLREVSMMREDYFKPLLKVCAVSAVSRFCGLFCQDAGEDTIGKIIELWGAAAAVCAAFPVIDILWDHISDFLGG